jgi:hypothetical protein
MQAAYLVLFASVIELSYFINTYSGKKIVHSNISAYILFSFFLLLSFTVFCGIRFNVGIDYMTYYNSLANTTYNDIQNGLTKQKFEPLYVFICDVISFFKMPAYSLFFVFAFITSLFFFMAVREQSPNIILSYFVYFSNGFFFYSLNTMRQSVAVMTGLYAFRFIKEKNIVKYILCILLASFMHKSVLILLPFYFIFKVKLTRGIIFLVLLFAFGLGQIDTVKILSFLVSNLPPPYNAYSTIIGSFKNAGGHGIIGYILLIIAFFLTVTSYNVCISQRYRTYFNAFLMGVFLINAFPSMTLIIRLAEYFLISFCIVFPLFYLTAKKSIEKYAFFIFILLLLFIKIIDYVYFSDDGDLIKYQTIFGNAV